ncbi:hypothetical protein ACPPVS_02575 [Cellulomonas sp. McL0617]|uniref:hypothetical protein n=1 Tax=Cellulomonas sp. McL0617 TaxID=3415675 RepID=UPI003CEBE1F0
MTRTPGPTSLTVLVLATCIAFLTAGCGTDSRFDGPSEVGDNEPLGRVAVEPTEVAPPVEPAPQAVALWECHYVPTYDDDWHNDVLCSDGVDEDRPYLREGDSYITEDEIMASAQEYQNQLNAS